MDALQQLGVGCQGLSFVVKIQVIFEAYPNSSPHGHGLPLCHFLLRHSSALPVSQKRTIYVAEWSNSIRLLPPMKPNNDNVFVAFAPVPPVAIILSVTSMASIDVYTQQSYEFGEGLEENAEAEKMTQQ